MNFSSEQIELITRSVLQQLQSRGIATSAARDVAAESNGLTLSGSVLTEAMLSQAGAAGKTVSIAAGCVVTPSGHDFIRRNAVTVVRTSSKQAAAGTGTVLSVDGSPTVAAAARAAGWSLHSAGCDYDAAAKTVELVGTTPVVCCGIEPSVIACLLNRDHRLRAAVVTTGTSLETLTRVMQPQVVCLQSAGWSFGGLLQLCRQLGRQAGGQLSGWKELKGNRR